MATIVAELDQLQKKLQTACFLQKASAGVIWRNVVQRTCVDSLGDRCADKKMWSHSQHSTCFNSFVSRSDACTSALFRWPCSISVCLLLFPRFGACAAGIRPLVSLLVGYCVRLVSLLFLFFFLLVSLLVRPGWSLCPPCLPSVSLCLRLCLPFCWALCPSCLPSVSFCLPSSLPCCLPCWSWCPPCLPSFLYIYVPPLSPSCLQPSHLSPSCSALQCLTFVFQLWAACRLQSFTFVSLCLHVSPSSGLLCPPLPSNPLHLSPSFGLLCPPLRWAAVSASALQSFTCVLASLCICLSALDCCNYPPLPCNPLFVTQLWAACRLQSFTSVSLCLHLSPSSGLLWPPLPCNPLSPSSGRRKL